MENAPVSQSLNRQTHHASVSIRKLTSPGGRNAVTRVAFGNPNPRRGKVNPSMQPMKSPPGKTPPGPCAVTENLSGARLPNAWSWKTLDPTGPLSGTLPGEILERFSGEKPASQYLAVQAQLPNELKVPDATNDRSGSFAAKITGHAHMVNIIIQDSCGRLCAPTSEKVGIASAPRSWRDVRLLAKQVAGGPGLSARGTSQG